MIRNERELYIRTDEKTHTHPAEQTRFIAKRTRKKKLEEINPRLQRHSVSNGQQILVHTTQRIGARLCNENRDIHDQIETKLHWLVTLSCTCVNETLV